MKNIIEDMRDITEGQQHLFNKKDPLFTVAKPSTGKVSLLSGYEALKMYLIEQDPNTIDVGIREFPLMENGEIVGQKDIWVMEIDNDVVFILRNNKEINRGQFISILKRTGFMNNF